MQINKLFIGSIITGVLFVVAGTLWLATAQPVSAQCGSQASSCKNCHEVQGKMAVNGDGAAWHTSHAFGDFCYICHAGNNQVQDQAEAHMGMVPPLSDVQASCQQCHPDDLQERSQVYATALGVEIGSATTALADNSEVPMVEQPAAVVEAPPSIEISLDDPNLVDYSQRYDEIVLGKKPTNWGNIILIGLIGLVMAGGGGFVIKNEKLVNVSFGETRKVNDEYPAEVVEMLPAIAKLKPVSRKSLKKILEKPNKAEKVFSLMEAVVYDEEDKEDMG